MCQKTERAMDLTIAISASAVAWLVILVCYLVNRVRPEGPETGEAGAFFAMVFASFFAFLLGICVERASRNQKDDLARKNGVR